jgi:hypothetical protein
MLTYILFKTQSMLLSATSRKGQPDADLQTVQKTKSMLLSASEDQPKQNINLHSVYNQSTFFLASIDTSWMLAYSLFKYIIHSTAGQSSKFYIPFVENNTIYSQPSPSTLSFF